VPRILRIINRFNLGGPTYNAAYLTKHISPEFETLLIGGPNEDSEASSMHILESLGVQGEIIPEMHRSINPLLDRKAYKKIKEIIDEFKPDIIHTHASKAGALGRIAGIRSKTPVLVHTFHGHVFHSYFGSLKTNMYKFIERKLAAKSSIIIAISDKQKQELTSVFNICSPDKVKVIPLGFDLSKFQTGMRKKRDDFRKEFKVKEDEVTIGLIGRIVPIKNHLMFLKVLSSLLDKTELNIKAFIIGDGESMENVKSEADNLNIKHCDRTNINSEYPLIFTSWIKNCDYAMAGLDIIALTSLNEGTPVSLIEAKAAGKAVISTKVGGVENIIDDNVSGLLCDVNDVEGFTSKLTRLVEDSSFRDKIAAAGVDQVNAKYQFSRMVSETEALYHELLKNPGF